MAVFRCGRYGGSMGGTRRGLLLVKHRSKKNLGFPGRLLIVSTETKGCDRGVLATDAPNRIWK
jgi:hypothetical protein